MSVSRVRENRMHGLTGGGWKRNVDNGQRRKVLGGNAEHKRRDLPSINATAPAAHPTEHAPDVKDCWQLGAVPCWRREAQQVGIGCRPDPTLVAVPLPRRPTALV